MPVNVNISYATRPTSTEKGILGVKVTCDTPVAKAIHMGLAIDTSGSMDGERIESVKRTLGVLISRLRVGDSITIVGFNQAASVVLAGHIISDTNRAEAIQLVNELQAGGGTNFEAGFTGLGALLQGGTASVQPFDAVVVLTDGHANEGITSAAGLGSLIKSYMKGMPVYTLGYGEDHNADLLRALSIRSQGTYTYIGEETILPASMGDLMASLQDEVAKSAVLSTPANWVCVEAGAETAGIYDFGSLIAGKPVWAIFEIPPTSDAGPATLTLTYKQFGVAANLTVTGTIDTALDQLDVLEQLLRCKTSKALDVVATALGTHDVDKALSVLNATIAEISSSPAAMRPLAIRMKAQLEEMLETANAAKRAAGRFRHGGGAALGRMASNAASNYGTQRGVTSSGGGAPAVALFSSPRMIDAATAHVTQYSQSVSHDPAAVHDAAIDNV